MGHGTVAREIADLVAAEGVTAQFVLLGDGNMHCAIAASGLPGMATYHVRHEHAAVAMAMGHQSAAGGVGFASVTHGPGFTQVTTALVTAVRARIPLVLLAGEAPAGSSGQAIDQAPLAAACGAGYVAIRRPDEVRGAVAEAFYRARVGRGPVVLGLPADLQRAAAAPAPEPYRPSLSDVPRLGPMPVVPEDARALAQALHAARAPLVLAGAGAVAAGARDLLREIARAGDALLATTLPARGLFDEDPGALGIVGGYADAAARAYAARADLVLAFGASLSAHTTESGRLFPRARIVQVDEAPGGRVGGRPVADAHVRADCAVAAAAVLEALGRLGHKPARNRAPEAIDAVRQERARRDPVALEPGTLDPRAVFGALEQVLPGHWDVVSGSAHQAYWHTAMRGGTPERYHAIRAFGAIGNGLPIAAGVAAARRNGRVVLFEGDSSLMMHVQELDTLARHGLRLLVVCCNDGGHGGEAHLLEAEGLDPAPVLHGRPRFAEIARAFGLRGRTITDLDDLAGALAAYEAQGTSEVWDVPVSRTVQSPRKRRQVADAARP
ncbi:thiamine pyrophosphate-binding protein [Salinarimonas rosea]|uniref:thiamine pyrophosphate-binding protein n=1 Tax=Salinarimonas rosea TaxID=552063 RepID=UPI00041972AA|nr:thiamine pyrophosphate-dependent enzyme [Salinarimonas rosea]